MIYLCRNKRNGFVKIGFSRTPEIREKTLQSEEPELFFEHVFPGDRSHEEALHRKYAHRRLRGEWFELTPEDVSEIVDALRPVEEVETIQSREYLATQVARFLPFMTDDQCGIISGALHQMERGEAPALMTEAQVNFAKKFVREDALGSASEEILALIEPLAKWAADRKLEEIEF